MAVNLMALLDAALGFVVFCRQRFFGDRAEHLPEDFDIIQAAFALCSLDMHLHLPEGVNLDFQFFVCHIISLSILLLGPHLPPELGKDACCLDTAQGLFGLDKIPAGGRRTAIVAGGQGKLPQPLVRDAQVIEQQAVLS